MSIRNVQIRIKVYTRVIQISILNTSHARYDDENEIYIIQRMTLVSFSISISMFEHTYRHQVSSF
jgi:hypothetical protein